MSESELESRLASYGEGAVPDERSRAKLRAEALDAFERSVRRPVSRTVRLFRKGATVMSHPVSRYAAVAAAVAAAIWLGFPGRSAAGFADLIRPVLESTAVRYKVRVEAEGQPPQEFSAVQFDEFRFHQRLPDGDTFWDYKRGRAITLYHPTKQATLFEFKPQEQNPPQRNLYGDLRNLLSTLKAANSLDPRPLPEKQIEGRAAVGYALENAGQKVRAWGDKATSRLLRLEMEMTGPPKLSVLFSNFEFDARVDDSQFVIDPPEGYSATKAAIDYSLSNEADFIAALKEVVQGNHGKFPDSLDPVTIGATVSSAMAKSMPGNTEPTAAELQKMTEKAAGLARGLAFAFVQPPESMAKYSGKNVAASTTPRSPVFWYRPKDSRNWRIVYTDFQVEEADHPPAQ